MPTTQNADAPDFPQSDLPFPVVGIGASAGGLSALQTFFDNLSARCDMAFVVVLHLSPRHESNVAAILQKHTAMPVRQVTGRCKIEKEHVYVIPPGKDLLMSDGHLDIAEPERPSPRHTSVDLLLRTLAQAHGQRAISVILSGTGSDGALGMSRIKEHGGVTFAQNLDDAEYDGMPRSAIETTMVDFVLPVADIPQKLLEVAANAASIELPPAAPSDGAIAPTIDVSQEAEQALKAIMTLLLRRTGHDFTHYKRATVLRRIERRLQVNGLKNVQRYYEFLDTHAEETGLLLQDMLIGVTNFFRDRDCFDALEREVLPLLFENALPQAQLRIWSAGCSTGEEAYSIAMLMSEQAGLLNRSNDVQIFATDIDERAIAVGRRGMYLESIVADVSPGRLRRFFARHEGHYQIKKEVRETVLFAAHNILRDPPFSRLNLISCRNLLIYLDREVQHRIFEMFHFALAPGGILFLGSSESAEVASRLFTPIDKKNRIYRANPLPRSTHYVSALPFSRGSQAVTHGAPLPEQKAKPSYAEVHRTLLGQFGPPTILVGRDAEILHLSDHAGRFLRYSGGTPSHNLLTLIRPELRLEIRTALFQATQTNKPVETHGVTQGEDGQDVDIKLTVQPVENDHVAGALFLVMLQETGAAAAKHQDALADDGTVFVVTQLEAELQRTKEQLQSTIEQYETSSEELKASNEELQAINEELRSATEELETSKEELQSINEELVTVNYELKVKVDETGKSHDDLQNFVAASDVATIVVDRSMRIKRFTPRAADIFNLIASDLERPLPDITHRLDYDALLEDAASVFDKLKMIERTVSSNDGSHYIARLLPYRTADDRIIGLVLTFVNISSLHRAEERMRLVAASTRDYAIITFDLDTRITSWNSGAERMFGYTENDILGQDGSLIFTPEDRAAGVPQQEFDGARLHGRAEDERWHMRKDGSRLFCSGVMTALNDGEIRGFAKIARDLTNDRQTSARREHVLEQEKLVRLKAEEASRLREEFLAILSHELKQPLNLIHLNAELLKRIPEFRTHPKILQISEAIRSTAMSQSLIVDDLLDLSRIHTGKLTLEKTTIDLCAIARSLEEALRQDAQQRELTIRLHLPEAPLLIEADRTRVEQILMNLLSNALKFTPPGGNIALNIAREDDRAHITVSDTGKGIDPDFLPKLFEIFHQGETGTTRRYGGLGIGLALVRELTEAHGGYVTASSDGDGKGARFDLLLPLGAATHKEIPVATDVGDDQCLVGLKFLLVDDEIGNLESFSELMRMHGGDVECAASAAEGLHWLNANPVDLVISDIAMPQMDGFGLLEEIRKDKSFNRIPVIAVTGFGRIEDVQKALDAGFAAHLRKPIDFDELLQTVRTLTGR